MIAALEPFRSGLEAVAVESAGTGSSKSSLAERWSLSPIKKVFTRSTPGGPGVVSRKIVQALDIPVRKKIHAAVVDDRNGTGEARHPVRL